MPIISIFPTGNTQDIPDIPSGLPELGRDGGLDAYTWDEISAVSAADLGDVYWSVGDTHSVRLNGTVGTLSLNTTLYAFILGFNHNRYLEGKGISFGTFKSAQNNGKDVCLVNGLYSYSTDGTKTFNMNHWGNSNYGGWKGCDLRYDILGSTNTAPSGYGSATSSGRIGYDAGINTATSPVAGTLMAALPSDLRAVMTPITKYTDNTAGSTESFNNVISSIDYLPLLSEAEIFGRCMHSNRYERRMQEQYEYYRIGNSRVKYCHNDLETEAIWWERSPYRGNVTCFCRVNSNGTANYNNANNSYGVAPAFKI